MNHAIDPISRRSLWSIAWMCFFESIATVMVFSLLPIFLVDVLGTSKKEVGLIEGVAVFLAFMAKVCSGIASDYLKVRKPIIVLGTMGSIITKGLFAIATTASWVFIAKSIDRFSKGVRSAPTDALIGDLSPKHFSGTSYGIRQSFAVFGAVCGGLIASLLMFYSQSYQIVFWCACIPAILALLVLVFFIRPVHFLTSQKSKKWNFADIKYLPKSFWVLLSVTSLLMLARFSEAFLSLRAKECGWSTHIIPTLMVFYELSHAVIAWPIGKLADTVDRKNLLLKGILLLTITNVLILMTPKGIFFGMILAGIHMGMTQGLIASLISESTNQDFRGTAFALYYLTTGIAILLGNHIAGSLSDLFESTLGAFLGGALFTSLSALVLLRFYTAK